MDQTGASQLIQDTISDVAQQMRHVSQQYDAIFSSFLATLVKTLENEASMAEAARTTLSLADEAVDAMRVSFVGQPKFDCERGCSACCHLYVAVPPGIPELINEFVQETFSVEERARLVERLEISASVYSNSAVPELTRARCPLLNDEGACMVYDVRPISCRSFTSTSRASCHDMVFQATGNGRGIDQNPARYRIYENATKALQATAIARGLPFEQAGLSKALLELLKPQAVAISN